MNPIYFAIPAILLFLVVVYFLFFIKRIVVTVSCGKARLPLLISVALLIVIGVIGYFTNIMVFLVSLLHILLINLILKFILFIIKRSSKNESFVKKSKTIYSLGIIPIVLTVGIMIAGYFNMTSITETDYTLYSDKLASGENIKIALVADSHLDNAISSKDLVSPCKKISDANPDVLLLAGDIFDEGTSKSTMEEACKILGSVKTKKGIYYVYGNHDKSTYGGNANFDEKDIEKNLKANEIHVLKDQVAHLSNFQIIGRMDYSGNINNDPRTELSVLMTDVDTSKFIIDLDHQPQETELTASAGIDLQLSGHTHGGQIWPAGLLNIVFHFNDYEYGLNKSGNYNIIVTSGISGWGLPVRTEKKSEFAIINVKGK